MTAYVLAAYRRTLVSTADRRATVLYLFDAAIRSCRQAADAIDDGRVRDKCRHVDKAIAAVAELAGALDLDNGGALAARLSSLYSFVMRALVSANAANNPSAARGCLVVLRTLREGWEQIVSGRNPVKEAPGLYAGMSA